MKSSIKMTLAAMGLCTALASTGYAQARDTIPGTPGDETRVAQPVASNEQVVVMPAYSVRTDIPRPVETVPIEVSPEYAGQQVEMVFRVDENGRPYNIDADTSNMPDRYFNVKTASLVSQLRIALQNWQFEPAYDADGRPIDRQVRLPMILGS